MLEEIWKPILGEEKYYISNEGRVKNKKGHVMRSYTKGAGAKPFIRLIVGGSELTFIIEKLKEYHFPTDPANPMTRHELHRKLKMTKLEELRYNEGVAADEALRHGIEPETWEDVYDTVYEISSYGNCRHKEHPWRPLKPIIWNGSVRYSLTMPDGKQKQFQRGHLVADHFIPNPYSKRFVVYKDGNIMNAHVDNLEWSHSPNRIN